MEGYESECIKGVHFTHGNFPKKHVKIIYLSVIFYHLCLAQLID